MNAKEFREAVAQHKKQHVDGGVPIAPCLTNLVLPILKKHLPDKMQPKVQKRKSNEAADACPASEVTEAGSPTPNCNAVGSATVEEEGSSFSDAKLSQTPGSTRRRRWKIGFSAAQPQPPVVTRGPARAKAAAKSARKRIRSKTKVQRGASSRPAARSTKMRRRQCAAKVKASSSKAGPVAQGSKCPAN